MRKEFFAEHFKQLQNRICQALESCDGHGRFKEDAWKRPEGGGGRTRVMQQGHIIEKGGVNFSAVFGPLHPQMLQSLHLKEAQDFFATGVSIVMHPHNPWVPIIHMNVRYFELSDGTYWFGGGIDLTPHLLIDSQAAWFHTQLKNTCDAFDVHYYPKFKTWADDYFFNVHRQETRGVGGIFFDYLKGKNLDEKVQLFDFVKAVGDAFVPIYTHLMTENAVREFGPTEKSFQLMRRSRYAEFNLVYDRGTKFGLETQGRIESILMSLPPLAAWEYDFQSKGFPAGEHTLAHLKKGMDWTA